MSDEMNISEKLKKILQVSERIKMEQMRRMLKLDQNTFDEKIIDWAHEFGLILDGDYINIKKESLDDFINLLDKQFKFWESQEAGGIGKIQESPIEKEPIPMSLISPIENEPIPMSLISPLEKEPMLMISISPIGKEIISMSQENILNLLKENETVKKFMEPPEDIEILIKNLDPNDIRRILTEYPNLLNIEDTYLPILCLTLVKRDKSPDNHLQLKKMKLYINQTNGKILKVLNR